jgi:hypothetical protein
VPDKPDYLTNEVLLYFSGRTLVVRNNPLSFIDVSSWVLFTGTMKRVVRTVWVIAANGCTAWLMFTRLVSVGFNGGAQAPQLWLEFLLEVILPIVGIVLELVNWKFARWVNVGSFAVAGCYWLAAAIWWRSDPFFGVLLIVALGLLTIAGLTGLVYRSTESDFSFFG